MGALKTGTVLLALWLASGLSYGLSQKFYPESASLLSPLNFPLGVAWLLIGALIFYRAVIRDGAAGE